jgi:hypothetical protein
LVPDREGDQPAGNGGTAKAGEGFRLIEKQRPALVTKRNLLILSLFQLKDEPEGKGKRQLRKAPFLF